MLQRKNSLHYLVLTAMMIAVYVILSRFLSISLLNLKIGFAFVPLVLGGMLMGPMIGGIIGCLGDIISVLIFPNVQFFPGFTLTAFLLGVGYGLFLYEKSDGTTLVRLSVKKRIVLSAVLSELIGSVLLNSLWLSIMYNIPLMSLIPIRGIKALAMIVVQILVIRVLVKYAPHFRKAIS